MFCLRKIIFKCTLLSGGLAKRRHKLLQRFDFDCRALAFSLSIFLRILPDTVRGISLINSTPPRSFMCGATKSERRNKNIANNDNNTDNNNNNNDNQVTAHFYEV